MKIRITVICIFVLFLSCKKKNEKAETVNEEIILNQVEPTNYSALKTGNYWIYQTVITERNGQEMIHPIMDSVVAENDTVIRGRSFKVIVTFFNGQRQANYQYLADSLHYIISPEAIEFSSKDTTTILQKEYFLNSPADTFGTRMRKMAGNEEYFTVPAGTFKTRDARTTILLWPQHLIPGNENPIYFHLRFASGIGMVHESLVFTQSLITREKRLVRYKTN